MTLPAERFTLAGYWGSRKETAERCEERLLGFLRRIGDVSPLLQRWYRKGSKRNPKEFVLQNGSDEVLRSLLRGVNRRDVDRVPIPELGYSFSAWNGAQDDNESASLSVHCGGDSHDVPNSCVLSLPYGGERAGQILSVETLRQLVEVLIDQWDPDRAVIQSRRDDLEADWIIYFAVSPASVPSLSRPSTTRPFGKGALVAVSDQPFSVTDAALFARAKQVADALATLKSNF